MLCRELCYCRIISAAATAAEDDEKGYDDKPDPLVFKKIAKTVIHTIVLRLF